MYGVIKMNSPDFLKNLVLDKWYKVFIVVGAVLFIVSLIFDLKGISNSQALLLAGGLFFFGVGEWINDGKILSIYPPNVYTGGSALQVTTHKWQPKIIGLFFDILGLFLILSAVNALLNYPVYSPIKSLNPTTTVTP